MVDTTRHHGNCQATSRNRTFVRGGVDASRQPARHHHVAPHHITRKLLRPRQTTRTRIAVPHNRHLPFCQGFCGTQHTQTQRRIGQFIQLGGEGVEVVTGSHSPEDARKYAGQARRYGLLASRGSDFHSERDSRADLGMLPMLPLDLKPVWHDWF